MALGDIFKAKENFQLKARVAELESMLTPEMRDLLKLRELISRQAYELSRLQALTQQEEVYQHSQISKGQAEKVLVVRSAGGRRIPCHWHRKGPGAEGSRRER